MQVTIVRSSHALVPEPVKRAFSNDQLLRIKAVANEIYQKMHLANEEQKQALVDSLKTLQRRLISIISCGKSEEQKKEIEELYGHKDEEVARRIQTYKKRTASPASTPRKSKRLKKDPRQEDIIVVRKRLDPKTLEEQIYRAVDERNDLIQRQDSTVLEHHATNSLIRSTLAELSERETGPGIEAEEFGEIEREVQRLLEDVSEESNLICSSEVEDLEHSPVSESSDGDKSVRMKLKKLLDSFIEIFTNLKLSLHNRMLLSTVHSVSKVLNDVVACSQIMDKGGKVSLNKLVELQEKIQNLSEDKDLPEFTRDTLRTHLTQLNDVIVAIRSEEELKQFNLLLKESHEFVVNLELQNKYRFRRLEQGLQNAYSSVQEGISKELIASRLRKLEDAFYIRLAADASREQLYQFLTELTKDPDRALYYLETGREPEVGVRELERRRMNFLHSGKRMDSIMIEYNNFMYDVLKLNGTERKDRIFNLEKKTKNRRTEVGSLSMKVEGIENGWKSIEELKEKSRDLEYEKLREENRADLLKERIADTILLISENSKQLEERVKEHEATKGLYAMQGLAGRKVIEDEEKEIQALREKDIALKNKMAPWIEELEVKNRNIAALEEELDAIPQEITRHHDAITGFSRLGSMFYQLHDLKEMLERAKKSYKRADAQLYLLKMAK